MKQALGVLGKSSRNTRKESVQTCLKPGEEDNFPPDLGVEGNMKKSVNQDAMAENEVKSERSQKTMLDGC